MAEKIMKYLKVPGSTDTYTFDATQFAGKTKEEWERLITGSVDYKGTVSNVSQLSAITPENPGDFVRVLAGFTLTAALNVTGQAAEVHAGDLLICENERTPTWAIIHGEEGNLITHKHRVTAAGTVSQPTFTGTKSTHKHNFSGTEADITIKNTPTGTVTINSHSPNIGEEANYTPAGTNSAPVFTGTTGNTGNNATGTTVAASDHTHSVTGTGTVTIDQFTPAGDITTTVSIPDGKTPNYTPTGTLVGASLTPTGTININETSGAGTTYTPTGTISSTTTIPAGKTKNYTPTGSVKITPKAKTIKEFTSGGSITSTYAADTKTLTLSYTAATGTDVNVAESSEVNGTFTGTDVYFDFVGASKKFAFTGQAASHNHTFNGQNVYIAFAGSPINVQGTCTITTGSTGIPSNTVEVAAKIHKHSFTPEGTNSAPTFTGSGIKLTATFNGDEGTNSVKYTPTGTISNVDITPDGTVSQPTFTGTEVITSNPE